MDDIVDQLYETLCNVIRMHLSQVILTTMDVNNIRTPRCHFPYEIENVFVCWCIWTEFGPATAYESQIRWFVLKIWSSWSIWPMRAMYE